MKRHVSAMAASVLRDILAGLLISVIVNHGGGSMVASIRISIKRSISISKLACRRVAQKIKRRSSAYRSGNEERAYRQRGAGGESGNNIGGGVAWRINVKRGVAAAAASAWRGV